MIMDQLKELQMENHEGSAQACATAFIRTDVDKLTKANLQVRREKKTRHVITT